MTQILKTESILKVLETKVPSAFLEMNRKGLDLGLELAEAAIAKIG